MVFEVDLVRQTEKKVEEFFPNMSTKTGNVFTNWKELRIFVTDSLKNRITRIDFLIQPKS